MQLAAAITEQLCSEQQAGKRLSMHGAGGNITSAAPAAHPGSQSDPHTGSQAGLLSRASIIHVHSTGRCGSTLLQKALNVHRRVQSLSEPDAFWCIGTLQAQLEHEPSLTPQQKKAMVLR